jgi:hypothetical protein
MTRKITVTVALSALLLSAGFAAAQDRQAAPPLEQRPLAVDPKACAPGDRLQAQPQNPSAPAAATTGENISDKLARTDGVICPPNVDPDIQAPTPGANTTTPVISPPGSPGGDPSVRPK